MSNELLCLFKSSRRQEYTQENLRILSGSIGDDVEVSYTERWLSEGVVRELPRVDDEVLLILADPPYTKSQPVRMGQITQVEYDDKTLRLGIKLGARVSTDQNRWKPLVESGPNPLTTDFVVRLTIEDGVIEQLADADRELKTWRRQIDAISGADGYARVAFLRVASIAGTDGPAADPPYQLQVGRTYRVEVLAYNPHLDESVLEALHLLPFPDTLRVDIATDEVPIPADGSIELMIEPLEEGASSLEFSVTRGSDFWFALQFDWMAEPAALVVPIGPAAPAEPTEVEPGPESQATRSPEVPLEPSPTPEAPAHDKVAVHLVRGYRVIEDHVETPAGLRLRLLDEFLMAVPGNERLLEQRGLVLHELRRYEDAASLLDGLTAGELSAQGRTALVASWFQLGRLPDPIQRVADADFSRDEPTELLLDASKQLTTEDQVAVARFLASDVLAEDRASRWLSSIAIEGDLPRGDRIELLEIWGYVDPIAAATGVEQLIDADHLDLADPGLAEIAFDLALGARRMSLARRCAFALAEHHAALGSVEALEHLLGVVMSKLGREERRELGGEIIRAISDVADEETMIDPALDAASDLIEDQRQRGDLDAAADLAQFGWANVHRVGEATRLRFEAICLRLDEAIDRSDTIRRYEEARRQELDQDLRAMMGGRRVVVVGAKEPLWWSDVRAEFGFDNRSGWVESEKKKAPDLDRIVRKLGKTELLVVQTGRIAHKTSEPLIKAAAEQDVSCIKVERPTRDAFTTALRRGLAESK